MPLYPIRVGLALMALGGGHLSIVPALVTLIRTGPCSPRAEPRQEIWRVAPRVTTELYAVVGPEPHMRKKVPGAIKSLRRYVGVGVPIYK